MAQLACIGLSHPLTKPPFEGCAIYFPDDILLKRESWMSTCHRQGSGVQIANIAPVILFFFSSSEIWEDKNNSPVEG